MFLEFLCKKWWQHAVLPPWPCNVQTSVFLTKGEQEIHMSGNANKGMYEATERFFHGSRAGKSRLEEQGYKNFLPFVLML